MTVDTDKLSVVDTPSAAILLDLQVGTYVQTKGYYSADGFGAATYLVVSNTYTPDNYGDFAMNNGNILIINPDRVNHQGFFVQNTYRMKVFDNGKFSYSLNHRVFIPRFSHMYLKKDITAIGFIFCSHQCFS